MRAIPTSLPPYFWSLRLSHLLFLSPLFCFLRSALTAVEKFFPNWLSNILRIIPPHGRLLSTESMSGSNQVQTKKDSEGKDRLVSCERFRDLVPMANVAGNCYISDSIHHGF